MKKLFALAGLLALTACSTSQLVDSLDIVTTAATAAVDALQSVASIPPQVLTYLTAVNGGITCTTDELTAGDAAAVQASKIAACFAVSLQPVLPSGTPSTVVSVIDAVASALANFLKTLPSATVVSATPAGAFSFAPSPKTKPVKLSRKDKSKLADIRKRAAANAGRIPKK